MAEKPTDEEISAALRAVEDATPGRPGSYNRALRDLARYRHWAMEELELAAQQEKHLSLQLVDARDKLSDSVDANEELHRRLKAKDAKIVELELAAQQEKNLPLKLIDAKIVELRREIQRLTTNLVEHRKRDITKGNEITKLRQENENLDAQIAALSGEPLKGKSYADAELGVIQDCLNALERIPATQRAAVTQYLTSRAHSAAWGAMPVPQHPAF